MSKKAAKRTVTKSDKPAPADKPVEVKTAEPGTTDEAAKKAPKRVQHPSVGNPDSAIYPFPTPEVVNDADGNDTYAYFIPADYDPHKHLPFKRTDFADEWCYYQWKLEAAEQKVKEWKSKRDEARTLGSKEERLQARKLRSMATKIAEIQSGLSEGNVDVAGILEAAGVDLKALAALKADETDSE